MIERGETWLEAEQTNVEGKKVKEKNRKRD
jgi:hypothetical protein